MIFVYIAGPFSAPKGTSEGEKRAAVERNIANAVEMGLKVCRLGAYPIIPHANTAHPAFEKIQEYSFWIEGTRQLALRACDAMMMVPGWHDSSGAIGEHRTFMIRGRPVFIVLDDLKNWIDVMRAAGEE